MAPNLIFHLSSSVSLAKIPRNRLSWSTAISTFSPPWLYYLILNFYVNFYKFWLLQEDGWDTEPFVLTEKDGKLFGRGSTDDKGPVLGWIHAIEAFQKTGLELPVNVKVLRDFNWF